MQNPMNQQYPTVTVIGIDNLTLYVFQDYRTSEYLAEYIYSIVIDVFNCTTVKVQIF